MTREMNTQSPATKAMNNIGLNLSKTMNSQPLVKAANTAFNSATNAATNAANAVAKTANNLINNVLPPTSPLNSSLTRMGNNIDKVNNSIQNTFNSVGDNLRENFANVVNNTAKALNSNNSNMNLLLGNSGTAAVSNANNAGAGAAAAAAETGISSLAVMAGIFLALVLTFVLLFYYFASEIKDGYDKLFKAIRLSLGLETTPPEPAVKPITPDVLVPPPMEPEVPTQMSQNILEKVLPLGRNPEVFNVSKNEFTFYDAEPLCRALGAELATYEQVKEAYDKGADWCNYGWVKGQVAIYPTQKATWDQLQSGPDDQKEACGRPGVNGGFFDNAEMRFGVNCYGAKPPQSAHDEAELMKQGRIPRTTSSLKVDEKVNEYKRMADSLGVMPFNKEKWGTL